MAGAPDRDRATHRRLVELAEADHAVDLTFVPPQRSIDITMIPLPGIEQLAFTGMTFGSAPLVAQPAVVA